MSKLYPTHVPLSSWQKVLLTMEGAVKAGSQRDRADLVALVGETTGYYSLHQIRKRLQDSEEGRLVLQEKPRVNDEFFKYVSQLQPTTLGGQYHRFMVARDFHPDQRPPVKYIDDVELAYVMQRYREVHDMWHVVFRCHTNFFGEVALKALEHVQTGLPMPMLAVSGTFLNLKPQQRIVLLRDIIPWAYRASSKSIDLMTIYYEKHLDKDLQECRQMWNIETAPQVKELQPKSEEMVII